MHHIVNQREEGVKVLSRIIFYLLLEKLVSRTPRSRTAARWKKLLTGNYVIIQVYFTSHNISTYIYLTRLEKCEPGTPVACARAREIVSLSCRKVQVFDFIYKFRFIRRSEYLEKIRHATLFPIYSRKQTIFSERVGPYIYKMIHK